MEYMVHLSDSCPKYSSIIVFLMDFDGKFLADEAMLLSPMPFFGCCSADRGLPEWERWSACFKVEAQVCFGGKIPALAEDFLLRGSLYNGEEREIAGEGGCSASFFEDGDGFSSRLR